MARGRPKERFCRKGHDKTITGRRSAGHCSACMRELDKKRNKTPARKKDRIERCWTDQGIKTSSGDFFTSLDYDRLYQIQQGKCSICKRHQTELKQRLNVDHDHKTGIVRGLLCCNCNKNLGVLEDNIFIKTAKTYLGGSL